MKVQCWISCGATCCEDCGMQLTGSSLAVLEAPRWCSRCKKAITQEPYPRDLLRLYGEQEPEPQPRPPITSFNGANRFLSNFYLLPEPLEWEGQFYPTTEHAFQAAKTLDPALRKEIAEATGEGKPSPGLAKWIGRRVAMRSGWDAMRIAVMEELLCLKFAHPRLGKLLLDTGDAEAHRGEHMGQRLLGRLPRRRS